MSKIAIGLTIKKLIKENKISVSDLSRQLNLSRQTLYSTFARESMTIDEIDNWASIIGVTRQDILNKSEGIENNKPLDKGAFGEETVNRINEEMARLRETFAKELEAKNQQIAKLQETITTLVGKSEGVTFDRFGLGSRFFLAPLSNKVGNTLFSFRANVV